MGDTGVRGAAGRVSAAVSGVADQARSGVALSRSSWRLILQTTIAAVFAYGVARVIGHEEPVFAPTAAVATVAVSLGNRMRRSTELVVGNAMGVALADLLVARIGTGAWQVGLVVALALVGALILGGGPILIMQSTSAAILIATIHPPAEDPAWNTGRFIDALIGGVVGLVVAALIAPVDPERHAERATRPLLSALAEGCRAVAEALRAYDGGDAERALAQVRGTGTVLADFREAMDAMRDSVRMAPWYWGQRRVLTTYALAGIHLDNAIRNERVLARQAAVAIDRGEHVSPAIPEALHQLASVIDGLGPVLSGGNPAATRAAIQAAVATTSRAKPTDGLFTAPMVAQIRLMSVDLLQATDLDNATAARLIRSNDPENPAFGG